MTQAQTETAKPRIRLPPRTTADTKGKSPIGYHPPTDRAPVVLAIRSGDWCALIDGLGRIVAQMDVAPSWDKSGGRRVGPRTSNYS